MKNIRGLFLICLFFSVACATSGNHYSLTDAPMPSEDYNATLDKWTSESKEYSGVVSTFQVTATMLSMDMLYQQIYRDAQNGHLAREQYLETRKKAETESEKQVSFFVALYTERDENNDLDKPKTLWNIFLDVKGRRVAPKTVKRLYEKRVALQDKYPYLTPWTRHYLVTFPVRVSDATNQAVTLTLASPLGASYLQFPQ